jgi:hypothetical protein
MIPPEVGRLCWPTQVRSLGFQGRDDDDAMIGTAIASQAERTGWIGKVATSPREG